MNTYHAELVARLRENADLDAMEHCNPIVIALEREAADAIEALSQRGVPSGWKLVPVDATPEMIQEARYSMNCIASGSSDPAWIYRAMLDAAPPADTQPQSNIDHVAGGSNEGTAARVKALEKAMRDLIWAASERDKKNRIRQFDEFMDRAMELVGYKSGISSPSETAKCPNEVLSTATPNPLLAATVGEARKEVE